MQIQVLDGRQKSIIERILTEKCIEPRQIESQKLHSFMIKIANRELTKSDWNYAQENFAEKTIISHVCNGSLGIYNELKKSMNDKTLEAEMIKEGNHPFFLTEKDSESFHGSSDFSTLEIQDEKNGTSYDLLFHKIRNSEKLTGFTAESLRAFCIEEFGINIPISIIKEELGSINKALEHDFTSDMKKIKQENMTIKDLAMKRARQLSIENNLDVAQSNELAISIAKEVKKKERSLAREISNGAFDFLVMPVKETVSLMSKKKR